MGGTGSVGAQGRGNSSRPGKSRKAFLTEERVKLRSKDLPWLGAGWRWLKESGGSERSIYEGRACLEGWLKVYGSE